MRTIILTASACTKPDQKAFSELLEPLRKSLTNVLEVPEKNRKERVWYNHLQVLSGGIASVGWVELVWSMLSYPIIRLSLLL